MIEFKNVSLGFGANLLIKDLNLQFFQRMKIGVVGKNGCGKSTLFSSILQTIDIDKGELTLPDHLVIAHVAQEANNLDLSAFDYIQSGDSELVSLLAEEEIALQVEDGLKISDIHLKLAAIDAYRSTAKIFHLLTGLGFKQNDFYKPVKAFSGGWRMRLNLARALMCRSDILLLDEPTNHLDFETVVWLEKWIKSYPGMLLVISHDKEFLDNTCTHILHIENQEACLYSGNYTAFERLRAEKIALAQAMTAKQEKTKAHLLKFITRFGAKASKAKQAQSRMKALQKLGEIAPVIANNPFVFQFFKPEHRPHPLLTLNNVSLAYQDKAVLSNINLTLTPDARIGVLGKNGEGKSTLIKCIAGLLSVHQGDLLPSNNLKIGYFAQHQLEYLNLQESPFWHIKNINPLESDGSIRNYLGSFGFQNQQALTPIQDFSGGEKARVALAMIVYSKPNLLLLDEPTNHLDLEMREALAYALQEFEGGLMLVSHDASLLELCCDEYLVIANQQVSYLQGSLESYRQSLTHSIENDDFDQPKKQKDVRTNNNHEDKKKQRLDLKKQQKEVNILEKEISKLQEKIQSIDDQLSDPNIYQTLNSEKITQLAQDRSNYNAQVTEKEEKWLIVCESLEEHATEHSINKY